MAGLGRGHGRLLGLVLAGLGLLALGGTSLARQPQEARSGWQLLEQGVAVWDLDGPLGPEHGLRRLFDELEARRAAGPLGEWDLRGAVGVLLLLAFHRAAIEEPFPAAQDLRAIARETLVEAFGEAGATAQGLYVAIALNALLSGSNRLAEAQSVADWALESFPDRETQPAYAAELLRLRSLAQVDAGRMGEARASLQALEALVGAQPASALAAPGGLLLQARMHAAWAHQWIELGVLDLGKQRLVQAFDCMDRSGGFLFQVLQDEAELLLRTEAFDELLSTIESWRQRYAAVFQRDERAACILELFRVSALVEAEREDPQRERLARAAIEELLTRTSLNPHDRHALRLHLVDKALLEGRLDDAVTQLTAAQLLPVDQSLESSALARAYQARVAIARGVAPEELVELRRSLEEDVSGLLRAWASAQRERGGLGFLQRTSRRQVLSALLELTVRTVEGEAGIERAIGWLLEAQSQGALARDLGVARAPTLAELRTGWLGVRHGALLLLPSKLEGSTHLFAFDRQHVRHARLPSRDTLRRAARELERLYAVHPATIAPERRTWYAERFEVASQALAALLLPAPVQELAGRWSALTLAGGELLTSAPLECLPLADGRRLGHALAVDVAPSLAVTARIASRPAAAFEHELGLVGVLSSVDDPRVRPLASGARLEARTLPEEDVRRLLAPFPPERVWSLTGGQATLGGLLGKHDALESTRNVHFLLHGVYRPGAERGACLVLAAAADPAAPLFLDCATVEDALRFRGNVWLSSCGSALGPERLGDDELAHLGSAFLRAGARCVVLARTPLAYGRTVALLSAVDEQLAAGQPPAEALRRARVVLGEEDDPLGPWLDFGLRVLGHGQ